VGCALRRRTEPKRNPGTGRQGPSRLGLLRDDDTGIPEFLVGKEAALMGRTTFEPALGVDRWPWPHVDVFVLASERPAVRPTTWSPTTTRSGC